MQYDLSNYNDKQQAVLKTLLERYSAWPLTMPAPTREELDLVFDTALRAPDHGHLKPWRFMVIQGAAREKLADIFAQAASQRDPQADVQRFRTKALLAPLVIALGVHVTPVRKVPAHEQAYSVAAATMNMLNALQALGYSGFWGTGANADDPAVARALGFAENEHLIGFLYVGTPDEPKAHVERPSQAAFVRYWDGL